MTLQYRCCGAILVSAAMLLAIGWSGGAHATTGSSIQHSSLCVAHVAEASRRFGVDEAWIAAILRVESAGDPGAVSPKGAMGCMQVMPATWSGLRARHDLGMDPLDPRDNVLAGAAYLRELRDRYGWPGALAAYNAGPARYEEHRAGLRSLPAETVSYLARLASITGDAVAPDMPLGLPADPLAWRRATVFVALAGIRSPSARHAGIPAAGAQSVRRPPVSAPGAGSDATIPTGGEPAAPPPVPAATSHPLFAVWRPR